MFAYCQNLRFLLKKTQFSGAKNYTNLNQVGIFNIILQINLIPFGLPAKKVKNIIISHVLYNSNSKFGKKLCISTYFPRAKNIFSKNLIVFLKSVVV